MTTEPTGPDESVVTGTDDAPPEGDNQDDGSTPIPDLDENPEA